MNNKEISIEVEAHSVEEAIRKALSELNLSREEVEIKVLTEGQKGLFGMEGAKLAKVKVMLKKKMPGRR